MPEIYFAPAPAAAPITLEQLRGKFIEAGLPCVVEEDTPELHWLVFEPHETTVYVSTTGANVTLATLNPSLEDDPDVFATIERVMTSIGFSAGEDADLD